MSECEHINNCDSCFAISEKLQKIHDRDQELIEQMELVKNKAFLTARDADSCQRAAFEMLSRAKKEIDRLNTELEEQIEQRASEQRIADAQAERAVKAEAERDGYRTEHEKDNRSQKT